MSGVRFAPSPTGAFHLGNFRTAWISYRLGQRLGKPWVLRFEDIDGPRVAPGSRERQLAEMERLGLKSERVEIQTAFHKRHEEAFDQARVEGKVYACYCSRKELREALEGAASAPHGAQAIYNGRCRDLAEAPEHRLPTLAWRFRMDEASGSRDFIAARTLPDGSGFNPAYNWACAVDDWDGRYDLLVRAWDLEPVAEQQRAIQLWLKTSEGSRDPLPAIYHTALVTQDDGHRLEKRTRGITLPELEAAGWTVERIVAAFERSWNEADAVPGEARRSLTLSELGFARV
jgi:glutamyl-tRNA synthetase